MWGLGYGDDGVANGQPVWRLLGATVASSGSRLVCRWSGEPLSLVVEHGAAAGPVALRFSGLPASVAASDETALQE